MIIKALTNTRLLGILYLIAVPVYAAVYSALPSHFTHANLASETGFFETLEAIETTVTRDFLSNLEASKTFPDDGSDGRFHGRGALSGYYTRYFDIAFSVVKIEADVIKLNATFSVVSPVPRMEALLANNNTEQSRSFLFVDQVTLVPFTPGGIPQNRDLGYYALMDKDFLGPFDVGPEEHAHALNTSLKPLVDKALRMQAGQSVAGWENYVRMLYFSAVTITTLGYGDIAPISVWSRLLIASEVLYGIIIVGLVLNSLSSRASRS